MSTESMHYRSGGDLQPLAVLRFCRSSYHAVYLVTQAHFHLLNHEQDVKKGNHIESLEVRDGNREHGLGRLILVFVREVTYGKDTNGR